MREIRCPKVPDSGVADLSFDHVQISEAKLPAQGDELNLSLNSSGASMSSLKLARNHHTEVHQPSTHGVLFATGRRPVQLSRQPPKKVRSKGSLYCLTEERLVLHRDTLRA